METKETGRNNISEIGITGFLKLLAIDYQVTKFLSLLEKATNK